ncbi:hypothetical protein [Salinivibrio phage CW02]|uniref:Uncharacterized protein n=1 Tax=Salinivibrio phage CW02 TaxID=1161935 RepID=H9D1I1_9CAUD|nr:hypothetical protein F490_gp14 [Salinivibrio phage CW02]AFE86223.1 hypothetical protein [Salinivibrio phage CW02]
MHLHTTANQKGREGGIGGVRLVCMTPQYFLAKIPTSGLTQNPIRKAYNVFDERYSGSRASYACYVIEDLYALKRDREKKEIISSVVKPNYRGLYEID